MTRACCVRRHAEAKARARGADEGVRGAFGLRGACAVVAAALLLGCATPPAARFHSLLPGAAGETRAASAEATSIGWELLPIAIPAQVDRPQLVVRAADDTIVVLEHERWIAPLADEMHAAISERLAQRFGPAHPRCERQAEREAAGAHSRRRAAVRFGAGALRAAVCGVDGGDRRGDRAGVGLSLRVGADGRSGNG